MSKAPKTLLLVVGVLALVAAAMAGKGDYAWEKWDFPGDLDCSIRYDGNGDGTVEEYRLISSSGYFTFKAGNPRDYVESEKCDWVMVFKSSSGSVIRLVDASWEDHANAGWKENFYIYPESRCLKYLYEGEGSWCGYDAARGVYFWGTWTTKPEGKPYVIDYIFTGDEPSMQARWTIQGCSDGNCGFEGTEGDFTGTRLEYGEE